ncbi:MAG: FG-GAP-like repeat-containing protein [Lacunisphaera sp.]
MTHKFIIRLFPRLASLQLPSLMLITLLQRTPVVRLFGAAQSVWVSGSVGQLLKASAVAATALSAVDTVVGATSLATNPASPVEVVVGTPFAGVFSLIGNVTVGSYTIAGLPPGLFVPNATTVGGLLTLNAPNATDNISGSITGTPTQAGSFSVRITAWDDRDHMGQSLLGTYEISVSEAADAAPSITAQPAGLSLEIGQKAVFYVTATGSPAVSFQWRKNGINISGATSSAFTIASPTNSDAGTYTVVVSNTVGNVISAGAILAVNSTPGGPVIITQPQNRAVARGVSVTFSVEATGVPAPTFQWRKNDANVAGATSANYTIPSVTAADVAEYTVVATNSSGSVTSSIATLVIGRTSGDFNSDGKSDIFLSNSTNGDRVVWLMNGATIDTNAFAGNVPVNWIVSGTGDFNGDGKTDLFWTNTTTGDRAMWLMNGSTTAGGGYLGTVPLAWVVSGTGDFNGDGNADILWTNTVTGERSIWFMSASGASGGASLGIIPLDWTVSGTGDLDGDGKSDVVLSNTVSGDRVVWLMNGSTIKTNAFAGNVPVNWTISGIGDFNGDGKADILWTNTSTGDRAMWLMNGGKAIGGGYLGSVPILWSVSRTGDFNGDGEADILWTNTLTGERAMWFMNGSELSSGATLGSVSLNWVIAH